MNLIPPPDIPVSSKLDLALHYAYQGVPVFPLAPNTKFPLIPRSQGGHGHLDATTDPEQITAWWSANPDANIGAATGAKAGFWVLDFDIHKIDEYDHVSACLRAPQGMADSVLDALDALASLVGSLADTATVRTPSGGLQLYYAWPSDNDSQVDSKKANPCEHVDSRGNGGYTVLPGSVIDGVDYRFLNDEPIQHAHPDLLASVASKPRQAKEPSLYATSSAWTELRDRDAQAYQDAHRYLTRKVSGILADLTQLDENLPEWGESIWRAARDLVRIDRTLGTGWTDGELEAQFHDACDALIARGTHHDSPERADRYWESAVRNVDDFEPLPPRVIAKLEGKTLTETFGGGLVESDAQDAQDAPNYPPRTWDDFGNADRVVDHQGDVLRFLADTEGWALFDKHRRDWEIGGFPLAYRAYRDTVEVLMETEGKHFSNEPDVDEEGTPTGPSDHERFLKYVNSLRNTARAKSSLKALEAQAAINAKFSEFDSDPFLLGVQNGVIELRTMTFRSPTANDMLTKRSPVTFNPEARCPKFLAYLEEVLPDPEVRAFLQRWSGYCLTGDMKAQRFALHQGPPGTGKSVYLTVMHHLLGPYYVVADSSLFHSTQNELHPTGLADIAGSRFIQASESEAGRKLNEALVNAVTTSEPLTARRMRQDFFDFTPTGKLNYVTNHLPTTNPNSGVWRRMILVHWTQIIQHPNLNLTRELIDEEAAGILNWALRGAEQWVREEDLGIPVSAQMAQDAYRAEEDMLGQFLLSTTTPDPDGKVPTAELYARYQDWCRQNGINNPKTVIAFSKELREKGTYPSYRSSANRGFTGLRLLPQPEQPSNSNSNQHTFGGHL